jgi:GNAT superfamily N-acetyltransferase
MVRTELIRPTDCSSDDLDTFKKLVIGSGEVNPEGFDQRVKRAEGLVFLYWGERVVGVAAIKRSNQSYKERVFKKAKSPEDPARYLFELGWVVVEDRFRGKGFSRALVERAVSLVPGENLFATTRADNIPMRKTNENCGFVVSGERFRTSRKDKQHELLLFTRIA